MTHLIGQQLGRYTIEEEIGRGGMARVYRARDTSLKRTVAIKVLAPQLAVDPEFAQRFEREAVTAANLRHPNIVTIYDVGEQNGLRYIAMEYVRGRTLHALIDERGALGLGVAIAIIGAVAAALDYAHAQGAVHRDIKPQNIMIADDGRVLLTDFGIAQAPDSSGNGERLTRTGIFMGTPEYISPEQASAQRVDGRSDLYSLGIATYEVITGVVPFSGATPQLIVAHAQKTPPPPSSIDPKQPAELDQVMGQILAKRPERRYASGAAFIESLRAVARRHGIAVATQPQLAALVGQRNSSAGESTISLGRGQTPPALRAQAPAVPAPKPVQPSLQDPTRIGDAAPRPIRPVPPLAPTLPSQSRPALPRPDNADDAAYRTQSATYPRAQAADRGSSNRGLWVIAGLIGGLVLIGLFVLLRGTGAPITVPLTSTRITTPLVNTQVSATPAPTATPTQAPTPTSITITQLAEPTSERPPPTVAVPVEEPSLPPAEPPTALPIESPTLTVTQPISNTPEVSATSPPAIATPTTEPPIAEPEPPSPTPESSATAASLSPTASSTPVVPTAVATSTPAPPTEAATAVPAANTPTATTGLAAVPATPNATAGPAPAPEPPSATPESPSATPEPATSTATP